MMSMHNVQNKKMYMDDIKNLPIYQILINTYGKIPKKEKIVEIVDSFSRKYGIKIDENVRSNRIGCLMWLNKHWDRVENFIRLRECPTFIDERKYDPVQLENEREETTFNDQKSIPIKKNVGNSATNLNQPVNVEIDYHTLYMLKYDAGELSEDN